MSDIAAVQLHNVDAVMARLSIGRSSVFKLIRTGQLHSCKVGRRRLVSETAISDFVSRIDTTSVA
ncbi:helix-turn-helix domain-containing protein [[Mycobacterium] zoologicum]|uniref:helix-turn-helix domain-containing protein n=1 Tax=[Mycobacterium] zoologicum TaxID=2872311 RepID=UPI001CDAB3F1|nr:helix-turn-helix domain-containing protein [Mycolicibacter sp. MYC101]MEB3062470.1 helix-turn-helix domain-containing protein [Mycolicibacter sp. MYC101]